MELTAYLHKACLVLRVGLTNKDFSLKMQKQNKKNYIRTTGTLPMLVKYVVICLKVQNVVS